jgi:hypothetical protein
MATANSLTGEALKLGREAASAYREETGERPTRETAGDRGATAWEGARAALARLGETDEDLWPVFLAGFYGDPVHQCVRCGRTLPKASDQRDAGDEEVAVDARRLVAVIPDWVCGRCLGAAEDEQSAKT